MTLGSFRSACGAPLPTYGAGAWFCSLILETPRSWGGLRAFLTRSAAKASVHRRRYVSRRDPPTCSRGRFLVSKASCRGEYDRGRPVPHLPVEVPDRRRKGHGPGRTGALYVEQERLSGEEGGCGWGGSRTGNDHRPVRAGRVSGGEGR